jgi:hypothetical protein
VTVDHHRPAEGLPKRDNDRGQAVIVDTAGANFRTQDIAQPAPAQPAPRWQVVTVKLSGTETIFSTYRTEAEATAVAARLCEVGCPAVAREAP